MNDYRYKGYLTQHQRNERDRLLSMYLVLKPGRLLDWGTITKLAPLYTCASSSAALAKSTSPILGVPIHVLSHTKDQY